MHITLIVEIALTALLAASSGCCNSPCWKKSSTSTSGCCPAPCCPTPCCEGGAPVAAGYASPMAPGPANGSTWLGQTKPQLPWEQPPANLPQANRPAQTNRRRQAQER